VAEILQGVVVMAAVIAFLLLATYTTRHISRGWTGFAIGLVFAAYLMFVHERIPAVQKGGSHVSLFLAGQFGALIVGWVMALSFIQRRRYRRFMDRWDPPDQQ